MRRCPVCDNPNAKVHKPRTEFHECPTCGLVWQHDRATLDETTRFYKGDNPAEAVTASKRALHESILNEAAKRLGGKGRLLDVGCGTGDFLATAVEHGWDAVGVEPVDWQVEHARKQGLNVYAGVVSDLPDDIGAFDFITYWDVIMMIEHPRDELVKLHKYIKRGGLVFMRVRQHQVVRMVERAWKLFGKSLGVADPTVYHPFNYTPKTLHVLSRRVGMNSEVRNGALTKGDAYGVGKKEKVIRTVKKGVEKTAFLTENASRGRLVMSPTMELWARPLE